MLMFPVCSFMVNLLSCSSVVQIALYMLWYPKSNLQLSIEQLPFVLIMGHVFLFLLHLVIWDGILVVVSGGDALGSCIPLKTVIFILVGRQLESPFRFYSLHWAV